MRTLDFGLFDGQAADFHADGWNGFRSTLVYGNPSNQEAGTYDYDSTVVKFGHPYVGDDLRYAAVIQIEIEQLKSILGQIPVLLNVDFTMVPGGTSTTNHLSCYRMFKGWDVGDSSNRYSDRTGLITWHGDAYAPYPGQDRSSTYTYRTAAATYASAGARETWTITDLVRLALRNNEPIRMYFDGSIDGATSTTVWNWKPTIISNRPELVIAYMYPIEFYESVGGAIDLSSTVQETEDGHYYLGAVERGATGAPTQGWVRNYTTATQQVELFDDHAEWVTPVQRVGTGTGKLDRVELTEAATSQLYTAVFYGTNVFEVKAEAYRDNAVGYHPQIDTNGSWRGTVGTLFTAPSGGFSIPADAWQGALIASGDEFEIGVRGNTTDTAWPYDSNKQVEMTEDDAGTADNGEWRPAIGRREHLTAGVTVDATSKFFPLRHMVPAEWPVDTPCYVHDQANIDKGTITSTQERDLPAATHTGSGLDDLTISGNYNGSADYDYRIVIDSTGSPDTFSWSRTGDATYIATGVAITGAAQLLENGVYITFGATTGHTNADRWDSAALTWGVTVGGLTSGSNAYNAGTFVCTTLPIRDLEPALWSSLSAASGASQSPASRIYLADTSPFTQNDVVFVQQVQDNTVYEQATIATAGVTATYIDLTSSLFNDYAENDFCTVKGTGEAAFWMRPVATSITVEELKRLRFNARIL